MNANTNGGGFDAIVRCGRCRAASSSTPTRTRWWKTATTPAPASSGAWITSARVPDAPAASSRPNLELLTPSTDVSISSALLDVVLSPTCRVASTKKTWACRRAHWRYPARKWSTCCHGGGIKWYHFHFAAGNQLSRSFNISKCH